MNHISLTKEDAAKLSKAFKTMGESFQRMTEAAEVARTVFAKFGDTVEQMELPEALQDESRQNA